MSRLGIIPSSNSNFFQLLLKLYLVILLLNVNNPYILLLFLLVTVLYHTYKSRRLRDRTSI